MIAELSTWRVASVASASHAAWASAVLEQGKKSTPTTIDLAFIGKGSLLATVFCPAIAPLQAWAEATFPSNSGGWYHAILASAAVGKSGLPGLLFTDGLLGGKTSMRNHSQQSAIISIDDVAAAPACFEGSALTGLISVGKAKRGGERDQDFTRARQPRAKSARERLAPPPPPSASRRRR
jgi:hypothetical protein